MKIYFDTLKNNDSNQNNFTSNGNNDYWLVVPGAPIKTKCNQLGFDIAELNKHDEKGIYFIDVRGDPNWWAGVLKDPGTPQTHILNCLPKNIIDLVKQKQIRLVINADREGGPMISRDWDCFQTTYTAMVELGLPDNSVLILQGNKKIESQYSKWLENKNCKKLYDMMYSNHFCNIFVDSNMPTSPVIEHAMLNKNSKDYNSLNRVYRSHRGAHLYRLVKDCILDSGIVSGNEIQLKDKNTESLVGDYSDISLYFPKFVDGDWSNTNAANQYNIDIYKNSLLSVITETIFLDDVAFITEKIFKPITMGHPIILFASQGTLRCLAEMGFKIDWCGIDPSYNDIKDNLKRFVATQKVLTDWVSLDRKAKIKRLEKSIDTIEHNFNLIRKSDFYADAIREAVIRTEKYYEAI
jgi:hypothetical protein